MQCNITENLNRERASTDARCEAHGFWFSGRGEPRTERRRACRARHFHNRARTTNKEGGGRGKEEKKRIPRRETRTRTGRRPSPRRAGRTPVRAARRRRSSRRTCDQEGTAYQKSEGVALCDDSEEPPAGVRGSAALCAHTSALIITAALPSPASATAAASAAADGATAATLRRGAKSVRYTNCILPRRGATRTLEVERGEPILLSAVPSRG